MYRNLLFDVDDTLLDFKAGELASLQTMFKTLGLPYSQAIEDRYLAINAQLWVDFEAGRITRDTIFATRMPTLFRQFKLAGDPLQAERSYRQLLNQQAVLLPQVQETLTALKDYRLFVVSNGIEPVQLARLKRSGLIDYFDAIFVSDSIGAPKPTVAFFDYVAKHIPHFTREESLIIGDSLTSDIQGGLNAKIDQVWFNPHLLPNRRGIAPTYQIKRFEDIMAIAARD